jgi:hypothetical protein
MEYNVLNREIKLDRELNNLDNFVIDFCSLLDNYVVVSGYVSILFGRSRSTEDVDLLVPEMSEEEFEKLWKKIYDNGFWCINTPDSKEAFKMLKEFAIRFAKERAVPNIEFKMIKTDFDRYSFDNKIKVITNRGILFASPIEMQIAFKLFLAADGIEEELMADKDIEDANHLYNLFKDKLNNNEFLKIINKMGIKDRIKLLK